MNNKEDDSCPTKCGCDPGLRTVATFYFEPKPDWPNKFIKQTIENAEKIKQNDPNYLIKQEFLEREGKAARVKANSNVVKLELKSNEYYEKAKFNEAMKQTRIERELAGIDELDKEMPSNKTVNVPEYEQYIR